MSRTQLEHDSYTSATCVVSIKTTFIRVHRVDGHFNGTKTKRVSSLWNTGSRRLSPSSSRPRYRTWSAQSEVRACLRLAYDKSVRKKSVQLVPSLFARTRTRTCGQSDIPGIFTGARSNEWPTPVAPPPSGTFWKKPSIGHNNYGTPGMRVFPPVIDLSSDSCIGDYPPRERISYKTGFEIAHVPGYSSPRRISVETVS